MGKGTIKAIVGIITVIIGGTVYSVSEKDIAKNFSEETGMSIEQAENYIKNIPEDELVSFNELGSEFIDEGQEILSNASDIDCVTYFYEWESDTLSCDEGKLQLIAFGDSEIALGEAYKDLDSESADTQDIYTVIALIDKVNELYSLEIISNLIDSADIDEIIKTNLYNKAMLQAVLDSE